MLELCRRLPFLNPCRHVADWLNAPTVVLFSHGCWLWFGSSCIEIARQLLEVDGSRWSDVRVQVREAAKSCWLDGSVEVLLSFGIGG